MPKSSAPTLSASSNCGPPGNSVQATEKPSGCSFFSSSPRAFSKQERAIFLVADAEGLVGGFGAGHGEGCQDCRRRGGAR